MNLCFDDDTQNNTENATQGNSRFEQYEYFKSCLYEGFEEETEGFNNPNNDLYYQECDLWRSNFSYLRVTGTSIKPPADFNSESVKSSINDLINEDYQEQEEIFAEHHDEQKLEKFNSADNLINAIAYHSILQGNNKQANFWDSDETEHSAETLVDAGNIDYGKTFRVDSENALSLTRLQKLNAENGVILLSDDTQEEAQLNKDFTEISIKSKNSQTSNCTSANSFSNDQKYYENCNPREKSMQYQKNNVIGDGIQVGTELLNENNMHCSSDNLKIINNDNDRHYCKEEPTNNVENDLLLKNITNNLYDNYYDLKCDTETLHTENTESYYDSISGHGANMHAFVPSRSNNELIKEQDSLTSLKSYGNKQELEDDNDSCIGLEGNLLLKHNVAPFYCNVRRPYVQDKGRFNRSYNNPGSALSRGNLSISSKLSNDYHLAPNSNNSQYTSRHSNNNLNTSPNRDPRTYLNIKPSRKFICRNKYKNNDSCNITKDRINLLNNRCEYGVTHQDKNEIKVDTSSIHSKQLHVNQNNFDMNDLNYFANKSDCIINNMNKLQISKPASKRQESNINKKLTKYSANYIGEQCKPIKTYEGYFENCHKNTTTHTNSKYDTETQNSTNCATKSQVSCHVSANNGDNEKCIHTNNCPKLNNHIQNDDSYQNNSLKTKYVLDKNEHNLLKNPYAVNNKIPEVSRNFSFPLSMAIQDIKLENIHKPVMSSKLNSKLSARNNKSLDASQNEKYSNRPPTSMSLKTLSPLDCSRVTKCNRVNKSSNLSIFTNLTTRKVDRIPSLRSKIFGNALSTSSYRKKCILPLEQVTELTKPRSSKKCPGNQFILPSNANKTHTGCSNNESQGSTWNLNHFNKIPPIKGSKI